MTGRSGCACFAKPVSWVTDQADLPKAESFLSSFGEPPLPRRKSVKLLNGSILSLRGIDEVRIGFRPSLRCITRLMGKVSEQEMILELAERLRPSGR